MILIISIVRPQPDGVNHNIAVAGPSSIPVAASRIRKISSLLVIAFTNGGGLVVCGVSATARANRTSGSSVANVVVAFILTSVIVIAPECLQPAAAYARWLRLGHQDR